MWMTERLIEKAQVKIQEQTGNNRPVHGYWCRENVCAPQLQCDWRWKNRRVGRKLVPRPWINSWEESPQMGFWGLHAVMVTPGPGSEIWVRVFWSPRFSMCSYTGNVYSHRFPRLWYYFQLFANISSQGPQFKYSHPIFPIFHLSLTVVYENLLSPLNLFTFDQNS